MKTMTICGIAVLLLGCAGSMPETRVISGSDRPALLINDAPAGASLFVDGLAMGDAQKYDGHPNTLRVESGVHQIEVRLGSSVIHQEKVFVSNGETRPVTIGATP